MNELIAKIAFTPGDNSASTHLRIYDGDVLSHDIFYEFSGVHSPKHKPNGNFAAVALLPYAMRTERDLFIDAPVERNLLESLEESQCAWNLWMPKVFKKINLSVAEEIAPPPPEGRTALIALSGGLDSVYALHAHKKARLGRRTLDICGGVLVHGFDVGLDNPAWFDATVKKVGAIADSYNLPLTTVRSNWRVLIDDYKLWSRSFISGLAGVMHQFSGMADHQIISHDCTFESHENAWGSNFITNPLVSSIGSPIHFTGGDKTRIDKARAVAENPAILENIRVCYEWPDNLTNCGVCEKCVRTKLDFLAAGVEALPGLGEPLTPEAIMAIPIRKTSTLPFFQAHLEQIDWSGKESLREALGKAIDAGVVRIRETKKKYDAYGKFTAAYEHFKNKDWIAARDGYVEALAEFPDTPKLHWLLRAGDLCLRTKDWDGVRKYYVKAVETYPDQIAPNWYARIAMAAMHKKQRTEAITYFRKAIDADPGKAKAEWFACLGENHLKSRHWSDARSCYEKAIAADPDGLHPKWREQLRKCTPFYPIVRLFSK